jgi:drug/metabolite transporter (DMT)-like permease
VGVLRLSRIEWICLFAILVGVLFFLVGANFYNSVVGWTGVLLFVGGVVVWFIIYVYCALFKRRPP